MIRLYDPEVTSKDISIVLKTLEKMVVGKYANNKEFEKLANFLESNMLVLVQVEPAPCILLC